MLKRLHYPLDVILTCVRWYVTYPLSLRHLEEMMSERGIEVDHSTVHRWGMKLLPVLEKAFRRHKRMVGKSCETSPSTTAAPATTLNVRFLTFGVVPPDTFRGSADALAGQFRLPVKELAFLDLVLFRAL